MLDDKLSSVQSVQSLSHVRLFETPWIAAPQASLSITNSRSLPKLMSISSSIVPFSCFQSFPASISFLVCQFFASDGQSIGVSASTSVLPVNFQDWFPLGWTGWISLQSKGLSRVFSNTTVQKQLVEVKFSLWLVYFLMCSGITKLYSLPLICVSVPSQCRIDLLSVFLFCGPASEVHFWFSPFVWFSWRFLDFFFSNFKFLFLNFNCVGGSVFLNTAYLWVLGKCY